MRFFSVAIFIASLLGAEGFSSPAFVGRKSFALEMTADSHIDKDFTAGSGMDVNHLPTMIDHLTADNFDESLEMMEPLLTNECVGKEYDDAMSKLKAKCKEIGKELPANYAPSHH
jgi:hypothetical protein